MSAHLESPPWKANLYDRMMTSNDPVELANKAIVTRYVDAVNKLDYDVLDSIVVEDMLEHDPVPGQKPGIEGLKDAYRMFSTPFPDIAFIFDDIIADGNLVVGRGIISGTHQADFFGTPPTGKEVHWTGTRIFRLKDLKVTEGWINLDFLGLLVQLGVAPGPPPPDLRTLPKSTLTGAPSTREANRAMLTRFIDEVWNKGNFDVADEIFHPEATSPSAPMLPPGPAGVKIIAGMFRNAFPDYWMRIDLMIAEEDRIAARFTQGGTHEGELFGIPPTGKTVEFTETGILRVADGKVVESWYDVDMAGMMQQLGIANPDAPKQTSNEGGPG